MKLQSLITSLLGYNMKYFSPRRIESARLALPILLETAKNGSLITYGSLNSRMGMSVIHQRTIGKVLDVIHYLCKQNDIPDLAALAVSSNYQLPGDRYLDENDGFIAWQAQVKVVHAYDWSKITDLRGTVPVKLMVA